MKQDCRDTVKGTEYMGKVNVTKDGEICQAWASQTPYTHTYKGKPFSHIPKCKLCNADSSINLYSPALSSEMV